MGNLLLTLTSVFLLVAACATGGAGRGHEARLAAAETPVAKGKVLYEWGCQRCHALYMPTSFYADEWGFYVRKYGRRARLAGDERALVLAYLEAYARK